MSRLLPDLVRSVLASLPTPSRCWWQPTPDTAPEIRLRLHLSRMAFVRTAMQLLPEGQSPSWRAKVLLLPPLLYIAPLHAVEDQIGRELLSRPRGTLSCPEAPPGAAQVAAMIFPHLPTNLSRYMYLSLLHDTDEPRFSYPALREQLWGEEMHSAIVALASTLVWWLCLIDEPNLQSQIRGCILEMSGGCVEDFLEWCRGSVPVDAPFFVIDHVLRPCLASMARTMCLPANKA